MNRAQLLTPALTVLMAATAALTAQAPRTIWVTATVTDSSGRVVTSLQRDDFRIVTGNVERDVERETARDVSVFSKDELPVAVSLMLDQSGSMRRQMANARTAAALLVNVFRRGDRINIGAFDSAVWLSDRFTANRARIQWSLSQTSTGADRPCLLSYRKPLPGERGAGKELYGGTGTAMWDGVWCGVDELSRDTESIRKVLVLITDGADNNSRGSERMAMDAVFAAGVTVYSVGFLGREGGLVREDARLLRLAAMSGGVYFPLEDKDPVEPVFTRIGEELHGQYVLGFAARSASEAGRVKVTVSDPSLTVRTRARY